MIDISEVFYQNLYFDKMMEIIQRNQVQEILDGFPKDKHHIIPRSYFKKCNLKVDNSKNNLVSLSKVDHALVHLYAAQCAKPVIEKEMRLASYMIFQKENLTEDFIIENQDLLFRVKSGTKQDWIEWAKENDVESYERYLKNQEKKEIEKQQKLQKIKNKQDQEQKKKKNRYIKKLIDILKYYESKLDAEKKLEEKAFYCVETQDLFFSISEAAEKLKIGKSGIENVLCGFRGTNCYKSFTFKYFNDEKQLRLDKHCIEYKKQVEENKKLGIEKSKQYFLQHSEEYCKKIICLETKEIFKSLTDAKNKIGSDISYTCRNKTHQCKHDKRHYMYFDEWEKTKPDVLDFPTTFELRSEKSQKRMLKYKNIKDLKTGIVYNTILDCQKATGLSANTISRHINKQLKLKKIRFEEV